MRGAASRQTQRTQCTADVAAGFLEDGGATRQARIGNRLQARGDRELRKTIEPARATRLQIHARIEVGVVDLGCQTCAEGRGIESGDQAYRRFAAQDAGPQSIDSAANGSERADAGNNDAVA